LYCIDYNIYYKRVCSTKKEPQQQGISYLEREREWVREREGQVGGQVRIRFGRDREIEGRDRDTVR
jgi:hypothetical protein